MGWGTWAVTRKERNNSMRCIICMWNLFVCARLKDPFISCSSKGLRNHTRLLSELSVSFDERFEPVLGHVGDQVVEHTALAEQGMGAGPDGVDLEMAVHAEALAGGAEQGEQDDGKRIEPQQRSRRCGSAMRAAERPRPKRKSLVSLKLGSAVHLLE
jgi:hypothetical protein